MTHRVKTALFLLLAIGIIAIAVWFGTRQKPSTQPARRSPVSSPAAQKVVDIFRQAAQRDDSDAARQKCLQDTLGPDRYVAITLSPKSVTPEEQFKILPCYQTP